ncbi:MAG: hypothetical protein ACOC6D_06900 [Atribacterota bacterium]
MKNDYMVYLDIFMVEYHYLTIITFLEGAFSWLNNDFLIKKNLGMMLKNTLT